MRVTVKGRLHPYGRGGLEVKTVRRLETANRSKRVVEDFEEFGEARQFEGLFDTVRDRAQYDLAAIVFFASALCGEQGAKPGAGHILKFGHIHDQFVVAVIGEFIQCLSQLRRCGTIHASIYQNNVTMLEFLGCYFHSLPPLAKMGLAVLAKLYHELN